MRRNLRSERGGARALPAGDALRHPRNAHAALRHPGIERADLALRADRGEAQADGAADQFGIQAAGAHGRDLPECGAAFRRPDGAEAGGHSGGARWWTSAWSGCARWRSANISAITLRAYPEATDAHRRSRTDGIRLLQSTYQRGEILAPAHRSDRLRRRRTAATSGSPCRTRASAWTRRK